MHFCTVCVLPETFPTINFDRNGVCNYCRTFREIKSKEETKRRYREKFENLLNTRKGEGEYDVLVAFSGGKDSAYALDIFKNIFHLRVLALTFDHGFLSPYAVENIKHLVEELGVDHLIFKPNFKIIKRVFLYSIDENLYSKKSLERASTICTSCMNLVKSTSLKTALEKKIPFLGYGWSPGQAPIQSSVMKGNADFIKTTQKVLMDPLLKKIPNDIRPYFLETEDLKQKDSFPYNVHPLAFLDYDEKVIYKRIKKLGWKTPKDTDLNSTNCLMNTFANQIHQERYGFHPYAFEVAGLVRMGILERKEGLRRLHHPPDETILKWVQQRLGLLKT